MLLSPRAGRRADTAPSRRCYEVPDRRPRRRLVARYAVGSAARRPGRAEGYSRPRTGREDADDGGRRTERSMTSRRRSCRAAAPHLGAKEAAHACRRRRPARTRARRSRTRSSRSRTQRWRAAPPARRRDHAAARVNAATQDIDDTAVRARSACSRRFRRARKRRCRDARRPRRPPPIPARAKSRRTAAASRSPPP